MAFSFRRDKFPPPATDRRVPRGGSDTERLPLPRSAKTRTFETLGAQAELEPAGAASEAAPAVSDAARPETATTLPAWWSSSGAEPTASPDARAAPFSMLEAVAAEVRKRQAETPAAPLPPPPALPPVAEAPIPAAGDDSLVSEAKAVLARLQAPARQNSDPILAQVDALLAVLDQEQAEIIAARTAERRLREDLARVNNENSQLRDLVKSLIQAIEDDQRRQAGVLDALDQRVNAANRRPRI